MTKGSSNPLNEIRPLTSVRFFIALLVFLFHFQIRWPITQWFPLRNILNQGAIGMTLFFMLSGFILAYTYEGKELSIREYGVRRFSRIYPVYFLAALLILPFLGFSVFSSWNNGIADQVALTTFTVSMNLLLLQAWFPTLFPVWNDGGSWSISAETFFYALFPAIRRFLSDSAIKAQVTLMFSYFIMVFIGIAVSLFSQTSMSIAYSVPIYRLGEFIGGVAIFETIKNYDYFRLRRLSRKLLVCLLPLLILELSFLGSHFADYIGHDWIVVLVFAVVLINLYSDDSVVTKLLSSGFFVLLGRASYSFYAIQAFFILFLLKQRAKLVNSHPIFANNLMLCLVTFFVLQASAIGIYLFFEKPIRLRIQKRFFIPPPPSISS